MTLAWDPSVSTTVTGYRLYYGDRSGNYTNIIDTGNVTTATVPDLVPAATYYFAVTAYDLAGLESAFSSEVSYTVPPPASHVALSIDSAGSALLTGTGPAGYVYTLLASTNLLDWDPLVSASTGTKGQFQFIDPASTNLSRRFYRLEQTSP